MSEDVPKYEGSATQELTPATVVSLLEEARSVMVSRQLRHARKASRAKTEHDRKFHNQAVTDSSEWIHQCDLLIMHIGGRRFEPKILVYRRAP